MTQADSVHSTPPTNTSAIQTQSSRRRFLAQAAGVAAGSAALGAGLPLPAPAAAAVDPIFAAIDEHKKAHAGHWAAIDELARMEKVDGFTDWGITEKPCHDENDVFDILLGAPATTLPGLLAKMAYLRAIAEGKESWMLDEREGAALLLIDSFTASLQNAGVLS